MKTGAYMKIITNLTLAVLAIGFLASCGGTGSTMRAVIGNQEFELRAQGARCDAGPGMGGVTPGLQGALASPLICQISYKSSGYITDVLLITVSDVATIYNEFLGQWLENDAGLVHMDLTFQGQQQVVFGQSYVRFTRISNLIGERACGDVEIETGEGIFTSEFCARVATGFDY